MGAEGASIQLLGGLSVRLGENDVTGAIGGRVGQLAFAYLVLRRDRAVRRDELAAAIWEENAPADPDAALRVVLTRLRKALGSEAIVGRSEVRLALPEPAQVDIELVRSNRVVAPGEDPDTRELLPGLEADWITAERALLADARTSALVAAGERALEDQDLRAAEQMARRLITLAPFREAGYRLLIQALAARDEVAEALRTYEDFRILLRDELGTSPSRELAELHMGLLKADEEADRPTGATGDHLGLPAPATPSGRPALAGRVHELGRLEEILAGAGETGPGHVLIGGEPGIGKTRLASELARRAHRGKWNVVWGRCHEAALVPYEPWVEALRQYATALSNQQLAELAHSAGTEFLALAPDLARRLPRAALTPMADDPQARRYRLFESLADLLTLAAGARPLVVVLEDMHWADQGTLLLLSHILTRPGAAPLLILGTYRTTEVTDEHPLRTVPKVEDLVIGGLTAEETAQIVSELAPDSGLAGRVHAETEGNPLFVLESLRAQLESGNEASVPGGIREVIDRRLRRVGRDAGTVLGAGAVLGRSFSVGEVGHVTGLPRDRLLDAVDESITAGLIEEVPDTPDGLVFTHALIREVRYRQHSRPRTTALHEAAVEALRAIYGGDLAEHLADLATHLEAAARDQTSARAAVEALRQAGEQAAARQAFEDAVGWLERAAALFELARPSATGRCDVLLSLAEALRASDRVPAARDTAARAAAYARDVEDGERLARAAFAFVGSHLVFKAGRPDAQDIGLLEEAVGAIAETGVLKVRLTVRLCTAIYYSDRFPEVTEIAEQALQMARQIGDEDGLGWAVYARFWDGLAPERAAQAEEAMQELRPILKRTKSVELASEGVMIGNYDYLRQGRPDLLDAALDRDQTRIAAIGIPIYRWFADALRTVVTVTQGRFDEADPMIADLARRGAALDPHDLVRYAALPMLQLRHHQGRFGELVEPLRMIVANNPGLPLWRGVLLEALTVAGEKAEAQALLIELAKENFRWLRRDVNWLWAISAISTACVELGDERTATTLHTLLTEIPEQSVVCGPALGFFGPVGRFIAPLAALIGRAEEAAERFDQAIAHLEAVGAIPLAQATRAQRDQLMSQAETSS